MPVSKTNRDKDLNNNKVRIKKIITKLKKTYPEAQTKLVFKSPYQLLVATILSAQCTDSQVNKVTPTLFKMYGAPDLMAKAPLGSIEKIIHSTGFYKNKAISLKEASKMIESEYQGKVPDKLDDLTKLRGVGRKTANVVLGNAFGVPSIVVDTHVGRLSRRLMLTIHKDPQMVEFDLQKVVPKKDWIIISHLLIFHGRAVCSAKRARCDACLLCALCPSCEPVIESKNMRL